MKEWVVLKVFKKMKTELPYDPAILHLGISPDKNRTKRHTQSMFSAALSILRQEAA